jgi:DNA-binding response OmpR family regulator
MFPTTQNLHAAQPSHAKNSPSTTKNSVLVVSPFDDDYTTLKTFLHSGGWSFSRCAGAAEALPQIKTDGLGLVVCEQDLPDGSWKTLLAACEAMPNSPLLLVVSRRADEKLWAEVLNLGGYDVLLKPFDRAEVCRVVGMAWQHWFGQAAKRPANSVKATPGLSVQYA